jgi:hypothetical protein
VPSRAGWRRILTVFAVSKVIAVVALFAGFWFNFFPFNSWNYVAYTLDAAGFQLPFINWDGQWYLRIAVLGYEPPPSLTVVFYPLLPALIASVMRLGLEPINAGLVVVTLFSATALLTLERLLPREERGPSSLWLLASYPTAFYLSTLYNEALFLTAFFGLLWSLRDARRAPWALLCAAALPLTRGQGLWLAAPLVAAWLVLQLRRVRPGAGASLAAEPASLASATVGYALGAAVYFAYFGAAFGNPLIGVQMAPEMGTGTRLANLFDLPRFLGMLFGPTDRLLDVRQSAFDKTMMLLSFLALLFAVARGVRDPFLLTAWACLAVLPAMMGEGTSYGRYSLLAWACFVPAVGPSLGAPAKWTLILAGFAAQAWLAYQFGGNRWVG